MTSETHAKAPPRPAGHKGVSQGDTITPEALRATQGERAFQRQVVALAKHLGWYTWHDVDSRRNAAGFPDLLIIRCRVLLWAELKTVRGKLSPAQQAFWDALRLAGQTVYIWRPADLESGEIERVLR